MEKEEIILKKTDGTKLGSKDDKELKTAMNIALKNKSWSIVNDKIAIVDTRENSMIIGRLVLKVPLDD